MVVALEISNLHVRTDMHICSVVKENAYSQCLVQQWNVIRAVQQHTYPHILQHALTVSGNMIDRQDI